MTHTNVSIFVPHYGCPHRCSFCDQRYISGVSAPPSPEQVRATLTEQAPHLEERGIKAQIAFFGGSFTAVESGYMLALLKEAKNAVESFPDVYDGIRCSTRPDAVDREKLELLREYGMTAIELGAQSMNDEVLKANERGHSAEDVRRASKLIREYGFSLGLQMMTGLYKDEPAYCIDTAKEFIALRADTVRIYPTVILEGTRLAELYKSGEYHTFGFDETIELCADLYEMFGKAGVTVIRLGLHASEEVERRMLGGVYHPALGELVDSRIFLRSMEKQMKELGGQRFVVFTDPSNISRIIGQKKENKYRLMRQGISFVIKSEDGTRLRVEPAPDQKRKL